MAQPHTTPQPDTGYPPKIHAPNFLSGKLFGMWSMVGKDDERGWGPAIAQLHAEYMHMELNRNNRKRKRIKS